MPAWLAAMMHEPKLTIVKVVPDTEQTLGVFELKVTASEDVAVAVSVIGVELNVCVPGFAKFMV